MILIDEATYIRQSYTFKEKNKAFDCLKKYIAIVKIQYNREIKGQYIDRGREYSLSQLKELYDNIGSILKITILYNPKQDSISERLIQLILKKVRSAIIGQSIPGFLWPEVFFLMIQITNYTAIVSLNNITLYKEFINSVNPGRDYKPYLGHLYILGCKTYVLIPPEDRKRSRKLDACAEIGILVRYEGEHIYRVQIPRSSSQGRIVRTLYVRFDKGGLITDPADDSLDHQDIEIPIEIRGKDVQQSR